MTETAGKRESFASRTQLWGVSHAQAPERPRESVSVVRIRPVGAAADDASRTSRRAAGEGTQPGLSPLLDALRARPYRKAPPPLPRQPRLSETDAQVVTVLAAGVALPRPGRTCVVVPSRGPAREPAARGWRAHASRWLQRANLSPVEALTAVTGLWLLIVLTVGALNLGD